MIADAIKDIESTQFSTRINLASDLHAAIRAIRQEPCVEELLQTLRIEPRHTANLLIGKLRHLRDLQFDVQYENPNDAAMAAYGWAIAKGRPELTGLVGDLLATLRNSWWASQLSAEFHKSISKDNITSYYKFWEDLEPVPDLGFSIFEGYDVNVTHSGIGGSPFLDRFFPAWSAIVTMSERSTDSSLLSNENESFGYDIGSSDTLTIPAELEYPQ